jgi:tetratricopeptide (TPR) repeat protein
MRVRIRAWLVIVAVLAGLPGAAGCRSAPEPDALFARAEGQRLRLEEGASREAARLYTDAAAAWERDGNARDAARAAQGAGASYWQLGALTDALRSYETALSLIQEAGDPLLASQILSDVGVARAFAADSAEALDAAGGECQQALGLARQERGRPEEGDALSCLGEVAYFSQRPERALELFGEAAQIFEALGDARGIAESTQLQGHDYTHMSRLAEARAAFERAQTRWTSLGEGRQQALRLVADARVLLRRGE